MFKRSLFLGAVAGLLAGVASLVYQKIYSATGADFSKIATPVGIISSSLLGSLLASVGFWLLTKWFHRKGEITFHFLFTLLSIASIVGPIAAKLPLDTETPELFPGLTIPMHFFPALGWFTLKPLFIKSVE